MLKVNDIVKVIKQPGNMIVHVDGEVGYIDELKTLENIEYAYLRVLRLDNSCGGMGWVPLDCLVIDERPEYVVAKQNHDERMAKWIKEGVDYNIQHKKLRDLFKKEVVDKVGITEDKVDEIFKCYQQFQKNNYHFNW